jgi:hypothetical protein
MYRPVEQKREFCTPVQYKIYAVAAEDSNGLREEQSYLIIK